MLSSKQRQDLVQQPDLPDFEEEQQLTRIDRFVSHVRQFQEKDLDTLLVISSPKGFGKSNAAIYMAWKYFQRYGLYCPMCHFTWITSRITRGRRIVRGEQCPSCKNMNTKVGINFNLKKYIAYSNEQVNNRIFNIENFSPIVADEGVQFAMAENWALKENKMLKILFAQMRTKHLFVILCIPKFRWLDRKYRDDMANFWIRILTRGKGLLLMPDLSETEDSWHFKQFQELVGSYNYYVDPKRVDMTIARIRAKHPCFLDYLHIPALPQVIYDEYKAIRDSEVYKDKMSQSLSQRSMAKLVAYNLYYSWNELKADIKRMGFEALQKKIFINPSSGKPFTSLSSIRKWVQETENAVNTKDGIDEAKEDDF